MNSAARYDGAPFSVWQWFEDDWHECVGKNLDAHRAVELAHSYTVRPAAQIGIIKKVTIVDCDDNTSFLWESGKGVVFPTREECAALDQLFKSPVKAMPENKIPALRVELHKDQIEEIEASSIWREVCEASRVGKPGFLAAQIHAGSMRVFFIDHERSLKFQELMGQKVGGSTADKTD